MGTEAFPNKLKGIPADIPQCPGLFEPHKERFERNSLRQRSSLELTRDEGRGALLDLIITMREHDVPGNPVLRKA